MSTMAAAPATPGVAIARDAGFGVLAFGALLSLYFGLLAILSGWEYTLREFARLWYYIVPLAAGFGVQVALFVRLRETINRTTGPGTVVAASGTATTAAMISCCAHYLVNVAPFLGATGLFAFAAQFQVQFFWVGLLFNAAGIAYIGRRLWRAGRNHAQCVAKPGIQPRGHPA